ncbi:ribbon-helix-helix domain-containing protein [Caldinitratiruptor microaerophilus]|uniref:Ribbon-helix-helix protein, copG family n=1 Tax=Caldinitratiruptor microaerophilus TaxID=671077 RepID=A0AA35CJY3_9FIRM|nr:CopG family transcriptional regulator [Caldinitratiruptor microaerophilus]BDG59758.1 hypothetical protein caldi_08480 [Caldinitratiruptor microaerophilus]
MATVKKIVYLTDDQERILKRLAEEEGLSETEIVRRAIEAYSRARTRDPLLDTIGIAQGGPEDGAVNHDRYLYARK